MAWGTKAVSPISSGHQSLLNARGHVARCAKAPVPWIGADLILQIQVSKLLIKRLLYNLQKKKHKEFPCCTSIQFIINLLKGEQRSNPPSRYSEGEGNKVSLGSLGSKHPAVKQLLVKADL